MNTFLAAFLSALLKSLLESLFDTHPFDRSDVRHISLRFKLRQFDLKVSILPCKLDTSGR